MGLSDQDRDALIDAVLDDAARKDGFMVLGPGGTDGNTPTLTEAVEQIVARHVAAALTEAADAIELSPTCTCESCDTYRDAARIVRAHIPPP